MLFKKYILTGDISSIKFMENFPGDNDTGICWIINSVIQLSNPQTISLFQGFSTNRRIAIGIGDEFFNALPGKSETEMAIARLFFQPVYDKKEGIPRIFNCTTKPNRSADFFIKLKKSTLGQGFTDLEIIDTYDTYTPSTPCFTPAQIDENYLTVDLESFFAGWLKHTLELKNFHRPAILITATDPGLLKKIVHFLQEKELELAGNDKNFQLSLLLRIAAEKLEADAITMQQLKNEVYDKAIYFEMQKKDLQDIRQWYHNEYEILPLWYKRLGHILKVMSGKRSFQSLFNDDVKKYKN